MASRIKTEGSPNSPAQVLAIAYNHGVQMLSSLVAEGILLTPLPDTLTTEVLVVGGGTGGTAAAIQAARRGAQTILVSEFPWLGGMLTAAGVAAPDGNELAAWQTGLWGAYLRALEVRQPGGLDHAWVSFFTYDPRIGAAIFADWVKALPNLTWIVGEWPREVLRQGDRILGVRFNSFRVTAAITIDATELGDLLALGEIPHRWGWEWQSQWQEPSAPTGPTPLTQTYPVQSPTWVMVMQDFGTTTAPVIDPAATGYDPTPFQGAWDTYGPEQFLNYGRLPGDRFMINWPMHGNDYGRGVDRLIGTAPERRAFYAESYAHSQNFAHTIQAHLGNRYGLAPDLFPVATSTLANHHPAFALYPYFRESRRLRGLTTVTEAGILPIPAGWVAPLPRDETGQVTSIAIGNYANDHHYPGWDFPLHPKSIQWGGRWTGTPFGLPYGCLVPAGMDGFLVAEKNISVSHIANGATRLQPCVLGIGQAAGMAAALCVAARCHPRELAVRSLQAALLEDPIAPAAVIPLYDLPPDHPEWLTQQRYYLDHPDAYPPNGYSNVSPHPVTPSVLAWSQVWRGTFHRQAAQQYTFHPDPYPQYTWSLVSLRPEVDRQLQDCPSPHYLTVVGRWNPAGNWLLAVQVEI